MSGRIIDRDPVKFRHQLEAWCALEADRGGFIRPYMYEPFIGYVLHGHRTGAFLRTMLEGRPWTLVLAHADPDNRKALVAWSWLITNQLPSPAWGSPEAYAAWIEKGGLLETPKPDRKEG